MSFFSIFSIFQNFIFQLAQAYSLRIFTSLITQFYQKEKVDFPTFTVESDQLVNN